MGNLKGAVYLISLLFLLVANTSTATTYTVTSANCDGSGSIQEAIANANANPGTDTITFAAGLTVNAVTCTTPSSQTADPADYYLGHITESVVFEGNGVNIKGYQAWMNSSGTLNTKTDCPRDRSSITVFAFSPGFIAIGTKHADNSGIAVEVRNMNFESLSAFAAVRDKASLSVKSSNLWKIMDIYRGCSRAAIEAGPGANLSITSTTFLEIFTWDSPIPTAAVWTSIIRSYPDAGDLNVMDSTFRLSPSGGSIAWSGGTANIVSSRFIHAGGINHGPLGTMNIVNSVFQFVDNADDYVRILAQSQTGPLNFIASSISIGDTECSHCGLWGNPFMVNGSTVNFRESAVAVEYPTFHGQAFATLGGGSYTADTSTWLQPVADQDAAALRALTGQPALMTDPPGLPTGMLDWQWWATATPLLGTPGNPGVLIDAIPDSQPGGANELLNPIDGSAITKDALGNPRVDGALRDIGAVELYDAPVLTAKGADTTAILQWSKPDPGAGATITDYIVNYRVTGSVPWLTWARHDIQLTEFVRNLSNGTSYDFRVAANTNLGQLPWSGVATATPVGPIHLTAAKISLSSSTLHFGNVPVGNNGDLLMAVWNTGNANLTIGSVASDNTVFTLANDDCAHQTIVPGDFCTILVRFSPTAQGAVNGHILIPSNAPTSLDKVGVSGIGDVASVFLSTAHLSFGDQVINTSSSPQTVTLTDNGGVPLTITSLASLSAEFVVSNDTCSGQTVNPGNQCTFDVHFTPTHVHGRSSSIVIASSAASSPDNVTLDGTGLGSYAIKASTGTLNFGNQPIHTSSQPKQITLTNSGVSSLSFSGISMPSRFSVTADTCTGQTVTSGNSCAISVVFTPNQLGLISGNLQISSNHPDSPHAVFLVGTGVNAPPIPVNSKIGLFILCIGLVLVAFCFKGKPGWGSRRV